MAKYAMRGSQAASRFARASNHQVVVCGQDRSIYRGNLGGPGGEYRLFEDPNLRIRNARQSETASRSAGVSKHQIGVELSGSVT